MREDSKIKPEMEKIILENYKTKTRQQIADILGEEVTAQNVQAWLRRRGLFVKKNMFSDFDIEYMKQHYFDMSYKEIGEKLGFTERQIRGKVNHLGLIKNRQFIDTYFENIDCSDKAYFLGLIYADGWIVYNPKVATYELGIQLQSSDKHILESLNNALGGVHKISHTAPKEKEIKGVKTISKDQDALRVYSKKIVNDLMSLNIVPNKTKHSAYPSVPDEYFFDFLRGYIDGDGCYYFDKLNNCEISITCSNEEPLKWISGKLEHYNIHSFVYKEYDTKYRLYCYRRNDVEKLISKMFYSSNILYLKRKYDKIKSHINGFAA